jgi:Tol biopolymer transport system component
MSWQRSKVSSLLFAPEVNMKRIVVLGWILVAALALGAEDKKANVLLQAGIAKETVQGDLKSAIELYEKALKESGANRSLAAQALLHMAECYQKLGDSESRNIYQQIVRDYGDQRDVVAAAHSQLTSGLTASGIVARQLWPGDNSGGEASLSPDGRAVVTGPALAPSISYAIRDVATGQIRKVLPDYNPGTSLAEWPILSPDSKRIAYAWCCQDGAYEIRVSAVQGGSKATTVLHNPEFVYYRLADWSPDGKSILAIIGMPGRNAQLAWISVSEGKVKTLKSLEWRSPGLAHLSPDGRFIAYDVLARQGSPLHEIRVMDAEAKSESVVVSADGDNASPVWTRDGSRILFLSKRSGNSGLWSIPVRNGKATGAAELVRPSVADVRPLGFTSSGAFLYVQRVGNQNVFVQAFDPITGKAQGNPNRIVDTYVGANTNPSWSPDGKSIAYISRRSGAINESSAGTLVIRSAETGEETVISTPFTGATQPIWFADGQRVLQGARNAQNNTCFYEVDLRTGKVRELVNTGAGLPPYNALSADGKIVFTRHPQNTEILAAFDLSTGSRTDIHVAPVQIPSLLAASPDGHKLAYAAKGSGSPRLIVTNTDGTNPQDLLASHPQKGLITGMAWSPDGQSMYFVLSDGASLRGHSSEVWRVPVKGGAPEATGLSASTVWAISLNPSNTRLVFGGGENVRGEYWALDNLERTWSRPANKNE